MRVRTMESDMRAIERTGGNAPRSTEPVPAFLHPQASFPQQTQIPSPTREGAGRDILMGFLGSRFVLTLGFLGMLVVLGLLGYFIVYPSVFQSNPVVPRNPPSPPVTTNPPPKTSFTHESFFRLPADTILNFAFSSGPVSNAADLQTFGQKLAGLINEAGQTGTFFEIEMKNEDGEPLALTDFLSRTRALVLGKAFLEESFYRDFTAFVYREKNDLWPGYVIRLKPGLTQLVLQDEVKKIETSPDVENLFLSEPSEPRAGEFAEKQIGTRPMRYLVFGNSGAMFAYSWFNSETLVISTSEEGLRRAFDYLGR